MTKFECRCFILYYIHPLIFLIIIIFFSIFSKTKRMWIKSGSVWKTINQRTLPNQKQKWSRQARSRKISKTKKWTSRKISSIERKDYQTNRKWSSIKRISSSEGIYLVWFFKIFFHSVQPYSSPFEEKIKNQNLMKNPKNYFFFVFQFAGTFHQGMNLLFLKSGSIL